MRVDCLYVSAYNQFAFVLPFLYICIFAYLFYHFSMRVDCLYVSVTNTKAYATLVTEHTLF